MRAFTPPLRLPGRTHLGTRLVQAFVSMLFEDPAVSFVQADPKPDNTRAIRCFEKSGFAHRGRVDTPDGEALLMVRTRL